MNATLRYWEYYGMQETFDRLYDDSLNDQCLDNLYPIIISKNNILLAYRTIKANKGSKTTGTDGFSINSYKEMQEDHFIAHIRTALKEYKPRAVKRVYIPKPNGDKRPLGIPNMMDRLIQQMIRQVIEPICEAKFYKHSYGFRPLRSTHHALSRAMFLVNRNKLHYAVDIDIEGFFNNVNHSLLLKQLWNIGIKDKIVLKLIYKMLKTPIKGEGIPDKGTPQGGILSPLLANVVLNDLDQWVTGQWEYFKAKRTYKHNFSKCNVLRDSSNMKEGFIVRYADDFKIFTRDYSTARKWFFATKLYLKDRLKLDISPDKSKIVNLRKHKSDFLGFSLYAHKNGNKWGCRSNIRNKKIAEIKAKLKKQIKLIQSNTTVKNVLQFNALVLGIQNYFKYATNVNTNLNRIAYDLSKTFYNRLKNLATREHPVNAPPLYKSLYPNGYRTYKVCGLYLYPIGDIRMSIAKSFMSKRCLYTSEGRTWLGKGMKAIVYEEIQKLLLSNIPTRSVEYLDNRISRYSMKKGLCEITKEFLTANVVHCHHYKPVSQGGTDAFDNLRIIDAKIHKLIHATQAQTIEKYLKELNLSLEQLFRVNLYRKACNLEEIRLKK